MRQETVQTKPPIQPVLFNKKASVVDLDESTEVVYGNVPDDPSVDYDVTFCSQGTYSYM